MEELKSDSKTLAFLNSDENKLHNNDLFSIELFQTTVGKAELSKEKHLKFLKELMSLDYFCRNQSSEKSTNEGQKIPAVTCQNDDDFFSRIVENTSNSFVLNSKSSNADLVYEALSTCDEFLIQEVYEKMSSCQLAVPLVTLRENKLCFHLWATRTVKKKWVCSIPGQDKTAYDRFISNRAYGTISFCRIGETNVSKSKVANLFMSTAQGWNDHSYFLHRDIDKQSKLNRGCIELCWYCPEDRPREHLQDIHCIYNLRGNSSEHKTQFKFLLRISSVVVIFMDRNQNLEGNIIEQLKSTDAFIIFINLAKRGETTKAKNKVSINGKDMNPMALSEELVENIQKFSNKVMSLKSHADEALNLGMEIDEMNEACQTGRIAAEEFMSMLEKHERSNLKEKVVPLQGTFWTEWGRLDKKESRNTYKDHKNPQEYRSSLNELKKELRKKQKAHGPSSEMKFFLQQLQGFLNPTVKKYFVLWCQISLNEISEQHLPVILKEFNQHVKQLSKLNSKAEELKKSAQKISQQENEELIKEERMKIKQISAKFSASSFGIEHVFREIGQIYESYEHESCKKIVSNLPKLMADLLIMGFPLEIMDGDATHVPLTWIKQVLSEVTKKTGNVNVFVLSILGIQSCGKSTLLNTMFGLKFAVASGRCTKGVFIQLLPVATNMRSKIGCDYFIIMDSEGLRSPELAGTFRHDNEIATLVACLGNTTVINFWGQTFSKDMSDIMQIVSYAYIRMKQVEIKSSFHIVFAGVSDVTAEENNRLGVKMIFDELNKIILKAAEEEGKEQMFMGLSSIFPLIQEELETVVAPEFLPTLWQGSMNPPEPRYGELLQQLKEAICIGLIEHQNNRKKTLRVQSIKEFCNRLSELWNAIKQENFVFSFKNSRAIEAFSEIQKFYDKELTRLRKIFFQHSYNLAKGFFFEQPEDVDKEKTVKSFDKKMLEFITPHQGDIRRNLIEYVSKMQDSELVVHHLENFCNDINKITIEWTEKEKAKLSESIGTVQKSKEKLDKWKKKTLSYARKTAANLRDRSNAPISNQIINESFEKLFNELHCKAQKKDSRVMKSANDLFEEIHKNSKGFLNQKLHLFKLKNNSSMNKKIKTTLAKFKDSNNSDFNYLYQPEPSTIFFSNIPSNQNSMQLAKLKVDGTIKLIRDKINNYKTASDYSYTTVIGDIIETVYDEIVSSNADNCFFNKKFKKNFLIQIYGYSVKELAHIQANYLSKCSVDAYLQTNKEQLFKEFESECLNAHHDTRTAARFIHNILCPIFVEQIKLTVGSAVLKEITTKSQFKEKSRMMFNILKDLLHQPFKIVWTFIDSYKTYVKSWIANKVAQFCIDKQLLQNCIMKKIKSTIPLVTGVLTNIQAEENISSMSITSWWSIVNEKLKMLKLVYQFSSKDVYSELQGVTDISFFTSEIINKITENEFVETVFKYVVWAATEQDVISMFDLNCNKKMLEWFVLNPLTALHEQRVGCTAQCPLCGALCAGEVECQTNGLNSQKHRSVIHMPQGIKGYRWVIDKSKVTFNLFNKKKENCLVPDICSSLISSNHYIKLKPESKAKYNIIHDHWIPYSKLNTVLYDWSIQSLPQTSATEFWQYLFVKHQDEFATHHGAKKAYDIPKGWMSVSEQDALRNLREMYGVQEEKDSKNGKQRGFISF